MLLCLQLQEAKTQLRQAEEKVEAGCKALEEAQAAARQEKERADGEVRTTNRQPLGIMPLSPNENRDNGRLID